MKKFFLLGLLFLSLGVFAKPYRHSLGVSMGNFDGFSWKVLPTRHFAVQTDFGFHITAYDKVYGMFLVNPNFMFQGSMWKNHICSIEGFIGAGTSLGLATNDLSFDRYRYSKYSDYYDNLGGFYGVNGIIGIEFAFAKVAAISFDFRPGYGMYFGEVEKSYYSSYYDGYYHYESFGVKNLFDWGLNLGVRFYI